MSTEYGRSAAEGAYAAALEQPPVKLPRKQVRYWDGTRRGLDGLCKWANAFYPLDDPVLTYNFTDDGNWDDPVLETENGPLALRHGDYVVFADGEFNVRRLGYDENQT